MEIKMDTVTSDRLWKSLKYSAISFFFPLSMSGLFALISLRSGHLDFAVFNIALIGGLLSVGCVIRYFSDSKPKLILLIPFLLLFVIPAGVFVVVISLSYIENIKGVSLSSEDLGFGVLAAVIYASFVFFPQGIIALIQAFRWYDKVESEKGRES